MMDFSEALKRMKLGAKLHRKAWERLGEADQVITCAHLTVSENRLIYSYYGSESFYNISHLDIMADDWIDPAAEAPEMIPPWIVPRR